ncbi:MAG: acyl-CoA dehydratase activase [Deltaproteobacteria bacterium]
MIVAGCDVGSLTGKTVILKDRAILSHSIVPTAVKPQITAEHAMNEALGKAKLQLEEIEYIVSTGYGREKIPFANTNVTEITCHGKGAYWLVPTGRTIIDIGGQDCKVILLGDDGNIVDFRMNDKCAAGTGRFLEVMAKALGLELDELGGVSLQSESSAQITSQCSVFAESEVVTLMAEGTELPDIVAGIHKSIADRLLTMVKASNSRKEFVLTGGVAKNAGVVEFLERALGNIAKVPVDPQIVGALGAALIAQEKLGKRVSDKSRSGPH